MDVEEYVYLMGEEVMPFSHKTHKTSRTGFVEDLEVKKFFFLFQDTLALMESRGNRRASKKTMLSY